MKSALPSPPTVLFALVLLAALPVSAQEQASLLHTAPAQAEPGATLVVDGVLTGTQRIQRVVIRYRGPGEPYSEAPMELQYGDLYRGVIPGGNVVPPGVEYYMEGYTPDGDRVPLFKSATRPVRVIVVGQVPSTRTPLSTSRPAPEPAPSPRATASAAPARTSEPEPVARRPEPARKGASASKGESAPKTAEPAPKAESRPEPTRKTGSSDDAMAALSADLPPDTESASSRPALARAPRPAEPTEPPPERSALEEDLALYTAEDTLALATRHEEKVKKVPAIGASFGREQIRALGARTVADVLDVVPGLTISRDVQGFHRVAIRGLRNDAEVLFLLNGQRLNSFFDGKALMNLPVENLERIEVIRGPGSALYGAGAFLAVVNLVTQRTEGFLAAVSGGGFPALDDRLATTFDGHASGAHSFGRFKLFGDADVWFQEGDSVPIETDALDAETLAQKMREPLDPVGYTQDKRFLLNLGLGFGLDVTPKGHLNVSARMISEDRDALMGLFDTAGPGSRLGWQVFLGDVTYEHELNDQVRLRARLYGDQQQTDRLFHIGPNDFRTGPDDNQLFPEGMQEQTRVTVRSIGASVDSDISLFEGNRLSVGAVGELQMLGAYSYETNYTLDSRRRAELTTPEGLVDILNLAGGAAARRLSLGAFAQDQWTVVEPLTLTLGVRVDATQLPTVNASNVITGTHLVPTINPRVGLVFSATDSLVLKLLYGRAFRPPTLQELVETIPDTDYNQGRFEGNPALQPAVVNTLEAGADLVQAAGDARVRLRANAFFESFSDPIMAVDTSGNIVPVRNRELGVLVYGLEGEARLEASKRANAWVNASLFRAEDKELPTNHQYLTDIPQARFNAGVSMPIGDFINFDLVVRAGAERRNNTRSVLELIRRYKIPAYSLITAQLRTEPIGDHFELAVVVHNVFDSDLRDDVPRPDRMSGLLPREGVSAFLTLRARN
ncbi:TonB-dependent receptor [Archangium violaceum]|uniref:TonB-dependent receptor domain-containing protein n=1 Tax=Archangium violaceum TaxID=83451 RepID=UPI0019505ABE|nr:TonB-dependent receptor [Archangium violaceum]QRO01526.1 TonB-dependent receptor [Archangium violaceum]